VLGCRSAAYSDGAGGGAAVERYSLVVHPCVIGTSAGEDGEFTNDGDRRAVVDMLIQIHCAHVGKPRVGDFVVPHLGMLQA
jgi:hypothetical protein